jgi:Zn-dependent protease with chaperone function
MSKYFQFVIVLLYVLLTICGFVVVLMVAGLHLSGQTQWLIITGWVILCFGSAYVRAGIWMFLHSRFRKPILAEEQRLEPALRELLQKAASRRRVRIWIDETRELNAVAMGQHTIAISKGLLDVLSPGELRGVLAHELGHLLSGDTVAAAAFAMAGLLPQLVFLIYRFGAAVVRNLFFTTARTRSGRSALRVTRVNLVSGLVVVAIFCYLLNRIHLLTAVIPVILFVVVFSVFNRVFGFLTLMLSRLAEYRQDAFAFRLGYGDGLRKVLEKLAAGSEPVVNRYYIVMHSTHPVIYHRIRRLEKYR